MIKVEQNEVIKVKGLTMEFKRPKDTALSLKEHILKSITGRLKTQRFKALDNISFTVTKGQVVGIIGSNGAGKSTLLKIISGALIPTYGSVIADFDKVQLLTLGTGFDGELTGRENVYLNGAIIGLSKKFIDHNYDQIVEFAGLGGFMDQKVKNYSTGMVSRLGFAIATADKAAEILILDEVLSVGDMFFRQKSTKRIKQMIHSGSTVLLVSHSLSAIKEHCDSVLWLDKGRLMAYGSAPEILDRYQKTGGG